MCDLIVELPAAERKELRQKLTFRFGVADEEVGRPFRDFLVKYAKTDELKELAKTCVLYIC